MKKILLFILPLGIALLVFVVFTFFLSKNNAKGALQVTSIPKSRVYLEGKLIGETPLCKCELQDMLTTGEYTVRLSPVEGNFTSFEQKISINKSVLTVVDRSFGNGATSEGSIITLTQLDDKKKMELLIVSFPERANVFLDNTAVGITPLLLNNLTESDHEIKLTKDGYTEKIVRIRTVAGYKLASTVYLGTSPILQITPTVSPSPTPTPVAKVTILNTPTGFLNVRAEPSVGASIITTLAPADTVDLVEEQAGWYKVRLKEGNEGWVSVQYAKKQ